jgi:hypothetical protein
MPPELLRQHPRAQRRFRGPKVYDQEGNEIKKSKGASAETWTYGHRSFAATKQEQEDDVMLYMAA